MQCTRGEALRIRTPFERTRTTQSLLLGDCQSDYMRIDSLIVRGISQNQPRQNLKPKQHGLAAPLVIAIRVTLSLPSQEPNSRGVCTSTRNHCAQAHRNHSSLPRLTIPVAALLSLSMPARTPPIPPGRRLLINQPLGSGLVIADYLGQVIESAPKQQHVSQSINQSITGALSQKAYRKRWGGRVKGELKLTSHTPPPSPAGPPTAAGTPSTRRPSAWGRCA